MFNKKFLFMTIWLLSLLVLNGVQEVGGSNPLTQTKEKPEEYENLGLLPCLEMYNIYTAER